MGEVETLGQNWKYLTKRRKFWEFQNFSSNRRFIFLKNNYGLFYETLLVFIKLVQIGLPTAPEKVGNFGQNSFCGRILYVPECN